MNDFMIKKSLMKVLKFLRANEKVLPEYKGIEKELTEYLKMEEFPFEVLPGKKLMNEKAVEIHGSSLYVRDIDGVDFEYQLVTEVLSKLISRDQNNIAKGLAASISSVVVGNEAELDPYEKQKELFSFLDIEASFMYLNDPKMVALTDHFCKGGIELNEIEKQINTEKSYAARA